MHCEAVIGLELHIQLATRTKILDMAATDGLQVTGAHLEFPGFGYVDRTINNYDFVQAAYDYS